MYISQDRLMTIEEKYNVITVQSDFPDIVYAIGKGEMWVINRSTGAQLNIAQENVYAFADELMSVAEVYLGREGLHKVS